MYIYKITVVPIKQSYIGFDTKPSYLLSRWKNHCRLAKKGMSKYKLHKAMIEYGVENCVVEIVEDGFTSIVSLALAEIKYIKQFDTFKNGLNSTYGGDGLGKHLHTMEESEILKIKHVLGKNFSNYNKTIKWAGTTPEQRKEMVKNSFTPEIVAQRAESLKKYYEAHPEVKLKKRELMSNMRNTNKKLRDKMAKEAGLKGALAVSKAIKVQFPDGNEVTYVSKSEMQRITKQWANTLLMKTSKGESHNGYKAWMV